MTDPFVLAVDNLMMTAAQEAAAAGKSTEKIEEARHIGCFLGLSMAKALYLSMQPKMVDNNSKP